MCRPSLQPLACEADNKEQEEPGQRRKDAEFHQFVCLVVNVSV